MDFKFWQSFFLLYVNTIDNQRLVEQRMIFIRGRWLPRVAATSLHVDVVVGWDPVEVATMTVLARRLVHWNIHVNAIIIIIVIVVVYVYVVTGGGEPATAQGQLRQASTPERRRASSGTRPAAASLHALGGGEPAYPWWQQASCGTKAKNGKPTHHKRRQTD